LGHNYIGIQDLLLGIVSADSPTAVMLRTLGLNAAVGEAAIARIQSDGSERGTS
jgi:hypothetical protein